MRPAAVLVGAAAGLALAAGAWLALRAPAGVSAPVAGHPGHPEGEALPELRGLTPEAQRALRDGKATRWKAALAGSDAVARRAAVESWEKSWVERTEVAVAVVPLLADVDPEVRRGAKRALLAIGPGAVDALLRVGLTSDDWEVPALAVETLGELALHGAVAEAAEVLLRMLADANARRTWRQHAALALGKVRPIEERVRAALLSAAHDPSDEVAEAAIDGLGSLGPAAESTIPALLVLLEREDRTGPVREILGTLTRIGRRPELVVPALLRHARGQRLADRETAEAVASFGRAALPHLAAALEAEPIQGASLVCTCLEELGPVAASVAPKVVALLEEDHDLCWCGLRALTAMGPAAASVVPALVRLAGAVERAEGDFAAVLDTLGQLGPQGCTALLGLAESGGSETRYWVCGVLALRCPTSPETRARLTALSQSDRDEHVRHAAASALRRLDQR